MDTKHITLRMDKLLIKRVERVAKADGRSRSNMIDRLIREALDSRK